MIQVIVYSIATGRVRRVVDPEADVPDAIAFLNQVPITIGEARLIYNKQGGVLVDTLLAWQTAVNMHTGKSVQIGQDAGDTYAEVDGLNNILSIHFADPACGDSGPNGGTLLLAPAGCSMNWTYNGIAFAALPLVLVKP